MTIEWNDRYKIGHADIDAQHQELFRLANQFFAACDKAGLTQGAMSFFKYTREHFAHEEQLMAELHYPDRQAHVDQHNDLISALGTIATSIAKNTLDKADLESFLSGWLSNHIGASDASLAAFVQRQQAAR